MPVSKKGRRNTRHVHKDPHTGLWVITKKIGGKTYTFGEYKTFTKARDERDKIEQKGWIETLGDRYESSFKNYTELPNGNYLVFKTIGGRKRYFGTYPSEDEAEKRVEELKNNGWVETWKAYPTPKT